MSQFSHIAQFSQIARFLHWLMAGLIVTQYSLAKLAENAKHQDKSLEQLALLANHKSVGITLLALAVMRLAYRFLKPAPKHPSSMSSWQITASKVSHGLLYGFLFALPLTGWLMSSAKAYSVSWFNLVTLPDLVIPSEMLAYYLHQAHHYFAEALFVVAVVHILAALKHHFIDKDTVLTRIVSRLYWLLFLLVAVISIIVLGRFFESTPNSSSLVLAGQFSKIENEQVTGFNKKPEEVNSQQDLPLWNIDYERSSIKFSGDQAGAPFTGEWKQWSAEIQFDESQLDKSRFSVSIDLSSGFSNDKERDDTMRSSDFFDVALFPQAFFRAGSFSINGSSHQTIGQLTMKGISSEATLNFNVVESEGSKVLKGEAALDRFLWGIGINDWADTRWVGQAVKVDVVVVAKPFN